MNWSVSNIRNYQLRNTMSILCNGFFGDMTETISWVIEFRAIEGENSTELDILIPFLNNTKYSYKRLNYTPDTTTPAWEEFNLEWVWPYSMAYEQFASLTDYEIFFFNAKGVKYKVIV